MIRPARPEEAGAVRELVRAAYAPYVPRIGKEPGPMGDDYAARIAAGQVWVLDDAAGIAAVLVLEERPDGFLLDNIAVAPGRQGSGLGRRLIAFAGQQARRRGWGEIRLYTHVKMTENIALYSRLGFAETGRVTEKGFERVYMTRQLGGETMARLQIIGAPQSNFVRTARIAAHEKGVDYELVPMRPHTPEVDAIHPFGKIPVMRHGTLTLCETRAICGYIDMAFEGPALMPRDPVGAAKAEQWVSLVNTGFDMVFARQYLLAYFFSGLPDGAPDRARIDAAVPKMTEMFGILQRELSGRDYLAGDGFTLADMFLLPLLDYLRQMPESSQIMATTPAVGAWLARIAARPAVAATVPPPMPGRG
jgi:glutathione S-transferase